jgi:hypothetical protein
MVIAIALLGIGAAGTLLTVFKDLFARRPNQHHLGRHSVCQLALFCQSVFP